MAVAIPYPLINGTRQDFNNVELKMAGLIFVGFKSITYKRSRKRDMPRGNSPDPLGKTIGENEYTGECEIYLAEWKVFKDALKSLAVLQGVPSAVAPGSGYGDVLFPIYVTKGSSLFDTQMDTLLGCSVDETDSNNSRSPDALTIKINLSPIKILFDGDDDLGTTLVAPPTA